MPGLKAMYSRLCPPAKLYAVISLISFVGLFLSNIDDPYKFTVGSYTAPLSFNNMFVSLLQLLYAAIWTWILNKFCGMGWTPLSWLLVLFPLVLGAVFLGIFLYAMIREARQRALVEKKQG